MAVVLSVTSSIIIFYLYLTGINSEHCVRTNGVTTESQFCWFGCCDANFDIATGFNNKNLCCTITLEIIIGIVVGSLVLLLILIGCCVICC
ncbi:hypothetical protein SNE40_013674 [Patella caerulea]|uniref:Transmembrane protein n=1 Tax=Patella caerulea TaxID=87958 RepID=A0AAN8PBA3_PATCE